MVTAEQYRDLSPHNSVVRSDRAEAMVRVFNLGKYHHFSESDRSTPARLPNTGAGSLRRVVIVLAALAFLDAFGLRDSPLGAATFTWNAGASGPTWSTASNWGGTVPGAADIGAFAGASYVSQPSLSTSAIIGGLWDTGAAAVTISGSALTLTGTDTINGNANTGIEADLAAGALTINAPLVLAHNQTWINNSVNPITVNGPLTGGYALTTSGSGSITLTSTANSYSGGTTVTAGTLQIGNAATNGAVGSGTYNIAAAARLYLDYATATPPTWSKFSGAGSLELNSAQPVNGSAQWCPSGGLGLTSSFSGSLQVDNGRVQGTPANLGGASNVVINNGAQFLAFDGSYNGTAYNYTQNFSISGLGWGENGYNDGALRVSGESATFSGHITLTGNTGLFTQSAPSSYLTVSGPISGPYNLAVNATGEPIVLSASNSYSGGTTLASGQLNIANAAALGSGTLTMAGGSFDNTSGSSMTLVNNIPQAWNSSFTYVGSANNLNLGAGAVTLGGGITATVNAKVLTVGGGIGGAYGLTTAGGGVLDLLGTSSYSGGTTITAGTLMIGGAGLLGNGNYTATIANGGALVVNTSGSQTFGGVISGSGAISQLGPGTLTANAANTFTGILNIDGGVFATNSVSTGGAAQGMGEASSLVLNGGAFRYTGGNSGTNFAPTVNFGSGGGTIDTPSGYFFYGGALSGSGQLTVINSAGLNSAWLLDTGNSPAFTGNIVIGDGLHAQGGIQYRSNAAYPLGTGTITVNALGLLTADNGSTSPGTLPNNIILNGGTFGTQSASVTYGGAINIRSNSFVGSPPSLGAPNSTSGVITVLGAISGAATASLTKNTTDTAIFAAANTYTGATIVAAGTLKAGVATVGGASPTSGAFGVDSPVAVLSGGTLDLSGFSETIGSLTDSGSPGGTITSSSPGSPILTVGGLGASTTFSGMIQNGSAALGLNVVGPGRLSISGSQNTFSGGSTISSGSLALVSAGTLGGGSIAIMPGGVLDTSALASGYTMTGGTFTAGRIAAPATDINGSLTVKGAVISIAGVNQAGTMAVSGNLTLGGVTLAYDWGDQIAVGGSLTLAGTDYVVPNSVLNPGTTTLFTYSGAAPNLADLVTSGVNGSNARQTYNFATSGGSAVTLTVAGVAGNLIWTGGGSGVWYTGTGPAANWYNTSSGTADYFYTNDYVTFSDSGSAAPNVTISGSVAPGSLTVSNTAVNYTFQGGPITGLTGLTKKGPGTLTLAQTNTFSGGTSINGGVIALGTNNALPIAGGLTLGTVGGNGTIDMAGFNQQLAGLTVGSGASSANQVVGNSAVSSTSTLTYSNSDGASTFAGTIQNGVGGSGGLVALTVAGGLLNLSGSNIYSGLTTIQGGTLQLGSTTALYAGGAANTVVDNGTLDLAGNNASLAMTGSGSVINSAAPATLTLGGNNASYTFTGNIFGTTLNLAKAGSGVLTLTGSNGASSTLVSQGTLQLTAAAVASYSSGTTTVNSGAVLQWNPAANATLAANTYYVGAGVLQKAGVATLGNGNQLVNADLSAGGVLDIQAGDLDIGGQQAFQASNSGGLNIAAGASFHISDTSVQEDWLTGSGTLNNANNNSVPTITLGVANNVNNLAYGVTNNTATFFGTIGGAQTYGGVSVNSVNLVKVGTGTQILAGGNGYSGSTAISGGTLQLGTGASGHDGSIANTSGVTDNAALVYNLFGNQTAAYAISGSGSLTKLGQGKLTLTGTNSCTGQTTVSAGTLQLGDGSANNGIVGGNVVNNSALVFANPASLAYGGVVSGSGSFTKSGAGTLCLTGYLTYSGPTVISAGTVRLGTLAAFGGNGYGYSVNSAAITSTPIAGNVLELTDGNGGEARSVFYNWPVSPVNGFTATFTYTPSSGANTADGVTFVLQNDPRGTAALGAVGGSFGYAGNSGTGINPSAAIDLNLYNDVNQTAYDINGNLGTEVTVNNVNFHSGDPINVSVTYNSQSQVMAWTLSDTVAGTSFSTSQAGVNLQSVLSGTTAYIGFSGGDGGAVSTQTISNFTYTPAVPVNNILPASTALTLATGATLDLYGASQTVGSLTGSGTVTSSFGSGSLTVGNGNASSTFAGTMQNGSGQLSLTKAGTGTFSLTGNVNLAGTLTVSGGTLGQTTGVVQAATAIVDGGAVNLSGNGQLAFSSNLIVGNSAAGTFTQTGGTGSGLASGALYLGYYSGASGTYNLIGSGLLKAPNEYVGYSGSGSFNQSGGTNSVTGTLNVGYGSVSNGAYSLGGSVLLSAQNEAVGVQGAGSFVQTGGTNSSAIFVSNSGSYSISGGLLQNTGAGATFVLDNSFQQSGGTINVSPNGFLLLTASAAFGLSGSGQLSSKSELIGYGGSGAFTQAGGTNSVTGVSFGFTGLILGYNSPDSGTYNLDGGLLNVNALSAGSGAAAFNFGGGTLGAVGSFSSSLNMTLTSSGGNAMIDTAGGNISLAGILSGSGGLTKYGSGTLILSGDNRYLGGTTVDGGKLIVDYSDSLPDGSSLIVGQAAASIFSPVVAGVPANAQLPAAVPEPGTWAICAAGITLLLLARTRLLRRYRVLAYGWRLKMTTFQ
jgi:fibronectin-binding autotransporter adhesin